MYKQTGLLLMMLLMLSLNACGLVPKQEAGQAEVPTKNESGDAVVSTPVISMIAEFDDIPIPTELTRNHERSSVYEAPGLTVGVIVYEGYYKSSGISKFFRNEMPKHDWQFINAFSEGKQYTLTFLKAGKSCSISIKESTLSTEVVIRVGPTGG